LISRYAIENLYYFINPNNPNNSYHVHVSVVQAGSEKSENDDESVGAQSPSSTTALPPNSGDGIDGNQVKINDM